MNGERKPREQGEIGELSAIDWLASQGAHVFVPVGHSPEVDLIAAFGDELLRREFEIEPGRPLVPAPPILGRRL